MKTFKEFILERKEKRYNNLAKVLVNYLYDVYNIKKNKNVSGISKDLRQYILDSVEPTTIIKGLDDIRIHIVRSDKFEINGACGLNKSKKLNLIIIINLPEKLILKDRHNIYLKTVSVLGHELQHADDLMSYTKDNQYFKMPLVGDFKNSVKNNHGEVIYRYFINPLEIRGYLKEAYIMYEKHKQHISLTKFIFDILKEQISKFKSEVKGEIIKKYNNMFERIQLKWFKKAKEIYPYIKNFGNDNPKIFFK